MLTGGALTSKLSNISKISDELRDKLFISVKKMERAAIYLREDLFNENQKLGFAFKTKRRMNAA